MTRNERLKKEKQMSNFTFENKNAEELNDALGIPRGDLAKIDDVRESLAVYAQGQITRSALIERCICHLTKDELAVILVNIVTE